MEEQIYKLFKGNKVIYVGKTTNLNQRLRSHKHSKCYTYSRAEVVDTTKLKIKFGNDVTAMERHIINELKPKFNIVGNVDKMKTANPDYQKIRYHLKKQKFVFG